MKIDDRALEAARSVILRWVPSAMAREIARDMCAAYEAKRPEPNPWRPTYEPGNAKN